MAKLGPVIAGGVLKSCCEARRGIVEHCAPCSLSCRHFPVRLQRRAAGKGFRKKRALQAPALLARGIRRADSDRICGSGQDHPALGRQIVREKPRHIVMVGNFATPKGLLHGAGDARAIIDFRGHPCAPFLGGVFQDPVRLHQAALAGRITGIGPAETVVEHILHRHPEVRR